MQMFHFLEKATSAVSILSNAVCLASDPKGYLHDQGTSMAKDFHPLWTMALWSR